MTMPYYSALCKIEMCKMECNVISLVNNSQQNTTSCSKAKMQMQYSTARSQQQESSRAGAMQQRRRISLKKRHPENYLINRTL